MLKRENQVKNLPAPVDWAKRPDGMRIASGSTTYPRGFLASSASAGLKKNRTPDTALLVSETACVAAGCFTRNRVQAAPVRICKRHIGNPIQAVLMNSKCANSYTGRQGETDALGLLSGLAGYFGLSAKNLLVASTGVIGERLPVKKLKAVLPVLLEGLGPDGDGAARAIMTTDTVLKTAACSIRIGGREVRLGVMAKGAGMIAPNMGTMLAFVTTDARIDRPLLQRALSAATDESFNRVTVDGDTSTNDTVLLLANGRAGNPVLRSEGPAFRKFSAALAWILKELAWKVVADGEGVTKVFRVIVGGAAGVKDAEKVCRAVAASPLVKTAVFGEDANWGRIVNAAGYAGAVFDPEKLDLEIGGSVVLKKGKLQTKNLKRVEKAFRGHFFTVRLGLNAGRKSSYVFTSDFSYDYVRINADYRS